MMTGQSRLLTDPQYKGPCSGEREQSFSESQKDCELTWAAVWSDHEYCEPVFPDGRMAGGRVVGW